MNDERKAFEAWATKTHGNRALSDPDAGSMWSAWQARATLPQPAAAQPDALGYATRLAEAIWRKHYCEAAPDWQPLDNLMDVLTQIDNMTSGLERKPAAAQPIPPGECLAPNCSCESGSCFQKTPATFTPAVRGLFPEVSDPDHPDGERVPRDCQSQHSDKDVCRAAQRDGVLCADGECDIDEGVRPAPGVMASGAPKHADCPFEHRAGQCKCTTRCMYARGVDLPDGAQR